MAAARVRIISGTTVIFDDFNMFAVLHKEHR